MNQDGLFAKKEGQPIPPNVVDDVDEIVMEIEHLDLIIALDSSANFATTHEIMLELNSVNNWTDEEIDKLLDIAIHNHPVRYLLNDKDVNKFYKKIIKNRSLSNEKTEKVESLFKKKGKK